MILVHLATSPNFGGPERLMLGLTLHLPPAYRSVFVQFPDKGKSEAFRLEDYDWDKLAELLESVWFACLDCRTPGFVRGRFVLRSVP